MLKFLKKRISISVAIGIILFLSVLVWCFTLWQHQEIEKEDFEKEEITLLIEEEIKGEEIDYIDCGSLLSNNEKILAVCKERKKDRVKEFTLYYYSTKETEELIVFDEGTILGSEWLDSWSPDDEYLVIDKGTSSVRAKVVFDILTKEKVAYFLALGRFGNNHGIFWLSNKEIIFNEPQYTPPNYRPWGGGEGVGISIINITTEEKKVLKEATSLKDYNILELKEVNGNIQIKFSLTEVLSPDDWGDGSKLVTTYWLMNQKGEIIEQIFE